ncbi:MAG: hypothetical protein JXR84_09715 [Anaerolineae bacterium]|nr:hypothetical protein [Anaerolineae bacterium]
MLRHAREGCRRIITGRHAKIAEVGEPLAETGGFNAVGEAAQDRGQVGVEGAVDGFVGGHEGRAGAQLLDLGDAVWQNQTTKVWFTSTRATFRGCSYIFASVITC